MVYEHTQTGWPMRLGFGAIAIAFVAMTAVPDLAASTPRAVLWIGAVVAAAVAVAWSRLTIRIDRERLRWAYGFGWPRFSLALADIVGVEITRTTFWQGWGVHRTRNGWLYNIGGYDAVRITRHDGRHTLLGTDEPRRLEAALKRASAQRRPHA